MIGMMMAGMMMSVMGEYDGFDDSDGGMDIRTMESLLAAESYFFDAMEGMGGRMGGHGMGFDMEMLQ